MKFRHILFYAAALTALVVTMAVPTSTLAETTPERVPVIIAFASKTGPAEAALVRGIGGTIKYQYTLTPAIAATIPSSAISALQMNRTSINRDDLVKGVTRELRKEGKTV